MLWMLGGLALAYEPITLESGLRSIGGGAEQDVHSARFETVLEWGGEDHLAIGTLRLAGDDLVVSTAEGPRFAVGAFGPRKSGFCVACKRLDGLTYEGCGVYAVEDGERRATARPVRRDGKLGFVFVEQGKPRAVGGKHVAFAPLKPAEF